MSGQCLRCLPASERPGLHLHLLGALFCLCLILTGTIAEAGKFNRVLSIGDAAPVWSDLRGVDGKRQALTDHKDAAAVVLVFWANRCPVAQAYEERARQLAAETAPKKVAWVSVSVS